MYLLIRLRYYVDLENSYYTQLQDYDAMDYPYRSNENAIAFITSRLTRSPKIKITEECCNKGCNIYELLGYYANNK